MLDPEIKKQQLLQEIEELEARHKEMQAHLNEEKEKAHLEIEQWWEEKQQEAKQVAEAVTEEASKKGFEVGFQQGMLEAEQSYQEKNQQIEELIQTAYTEKEKIIQSSEAFLLTLSVRIAEKIIKTELSMDNEKLVHLVRTALKNIDESVDITVQVAAGDYPAILPFIEELQTYVSADTELKLIPSSSLSPGGCMIHTPSGSYDATVDSQLSEIKKVLLAYCEEKTTDEHRS